MQKFWMWRRFSSLAIVVAMATSIAGIGTACDPASSSWAWKLGSTHGAIIETTAGRASLGVYRAPTRALYRVLNGAGIGVVQNVLWQYGKPPELRKTFTYQGHSVTISFGYATRVLRNTAHRVIFDDPSDLRGALVSAHARDSCLAVTLVSYGQPTTNWTDKQTDCRTGYIPK